MNIRTIYIAALLFLVSPRFAYAKNIELLEPVKSPVQQSCIVGGCSNELCVNSSEMPVYSTCLWKEEYACLNNARCEIQSNGNCGWTLTQEYNACRGIINDPPASLTPTNTPTVTPISTPLPTTNPTFIITPSLSPTPIPIVTKENESVVLQPEPETKIPTPSILILSQSSLNSAKLITVSISSHVRNDRIKSDHSKESLPLFYLRIRNHIKSLLPSLLE